MSAAVPHHVTAERNDMIVTLKRGGMKHAAIAKRLGCSVNIVNRVSKDVKQLADVTVPDWVPASLRQGYRIRVRGEDDREAASWARQKKGELRRSVMPSASARGLR